MHGQPFFCTECMKKILSFSIPLIICLLACLGLHITPFGNHSLLISDANVAYVNNLGLVRDVFTGKRDFLYALQCGLGDSSLIGWGFGNFHPFFLLSIFVDEVNYPQLLTWISILHFSICGFTMYLLLQDISKERKDILSNGVVNLIFSTSYALIGYNVANVFQTCFFLGPEILPLVVLGLHKILRRESPILYIISLAYLILTNFYFGYMICILSFLLFLRWVISSDANGTQKKHTAAVYFASSIISGLFPAFIWLPALLSQRGARLNQNSILNFSMKENMPILDIFSKFFTGANDVNELINGLPNIFCGIFVLYFVIVFFIDRKNSRREKLMHGILLVFYLVSFYIVAFTMAMQGFSTTNWFNYRYSFIFSFLMILTAADAFRKLENIDKKTFARALVVLLILTGLTFSKSYSYVSGGEMLLDIVILALMLCAIIWHKKDPEKAPTGTLNILLLLLCCINLYANYTICTYKLRPFEKTESDYQDKILPESALIEAVESTDSTLHRVESDNKHSGVGGNEACLLNYNGVSSFGSSKQTYVSKGLNQLGIYWYSTTLGYSRHIAPAVDSLLGLKYIVSTQDLVKQKGYENLVSIEGDSLFKNPYALSLGILSKEALTDTEFNYDAFQNINTIWKGLTGGQEDIYNEEKNIVFTVHASMDGATINKQAAEEKAGEAQISMSMNSTDTAVSAQSGSDSTDWVSGDAYISYSFTATQDGAVYAYNGGAMTEEYGSASMPMQYIGTYKKGDTVEGKIPIAAGGLTEGTVDWTCGNFHVAYENRDVLAAYSEMLQSSSGTFEKIKDSHLKGQVDAEQDSYLFFTIPYDEGWKLMVDGQEVSLSKSGSIFMSAPICKGTHSYELVFFPIGMKTGFMISGAALAGFIVLMGMLLMKRRRPSKSAARTTTA